MIRLFLLTICILIRITPTIYAQSPGSPRSETPRLVIGLVVENMRPDYVSRYWNKFGPNGFRKLYSGGTEFTNVSLPLRHHNYASGTATLYTGVYPSMHGIVGNTWYDNLRKKITDSTEDDYFITVGADTRFGNASPKKLLSTTVTDNLKIFSQGKSRVFSVAMNRESAIFSAGHAADGAFWFDPESGRMISSSFYFSTFPDWALNYNRENFAARYSAQNWITQRPITDYAESLPDNYPLEPGYFNQYNTFPHNLRTYTREAESFNPIKTMPFANRMVKDLAIELLLREPMGDDEYTDFLTIVLSSMDYEQGSFGPASVEMQDTYLQMDAIIGEFLEFVEKKFGMDQVLIFLTANTSASYPAQYLKEDYHIPVDNFLPENALALLTSYLNITYGEENWIEYADDLQIYLNQEAIKKNKIDLIDMREDAASFINQFEGVYIAMTAHQLEQNFSAGGILSTMFNSYAKNRSGDILFLLKEGWIPKFKFKNVNYTDQSHIPLLFYGKGVPAQTIGTTIDAASLAPTLCELLHIPRPDKSKGTSFANAFFP